MKSLFTESSNVVLSPAASTETSVTSVSPIISADAVDAVRDGFRIELPRASMPGCAAEPRGRAAEHAGDRAARASVRASRRR